MRDVFFSVKLLAKRLGIIIAAYTVCRLLFYLFNYNFFNEAGLRVFIYGLKFDLSAIFITNSLFILLHLLPLQARHSREYQIFLKALFIAVNGIALLFNCIDIEFFKFTSKRATADIFRFIGLSDDFLALLPRLLLDYWYIPLAWLALMYGCIKLYNKTAGGGQYPRKVYYLKESVIMAGGIILSIIIIRGGIQLKPLHFLNAAQYTSSKNIPLLLNTSFTIIKTMEESASLQEAHYLPPGELHSIFSPVRQFPANEFNKLNVVYVVMESFSKEYIGSLSGLTSYTPFLDSLIGESFVFTNAFANGKKSIEGIPAIISGTPALMNAPYITSEYSMNDLTSIASILKKEGYHTSFYHGGTNGTMGLNGYAGMAGIEHYYGLNEYPDKSDYDRHWGIWDEPYFRYFAEQLNKTPEPFFSCVFSLSSHHPFKVPEKYKDKFTGGTLAIHPSVMYADYALRQFFKAAERMGWFKNTLFVITADHTGPAGSEFYSNSVGNYQVPVIFYYPAGKLKGTSGLTTQQIDILPTTLFLLNYPEKFFSFGGNVMDTLNRGGAVNYISGIYQFIRDDYVLQFDGDNSTALFHYASDSLLQNNLLEQEKERAAEMERYLKAFIQTYNYSLINNKISVR